MVMRSSRGFGLSIRCTSQRRWHVVLIGVGQGFHFGGNDLPEHEVVQRGLKSAINRGLHLLGPGDGARRNR